MFTERALQILKGKYYWEGETEPEQLFLRVATAIAKAEKPGDREKWEKTFFDLMVEQKFIPNTPTLKNAGNSRGLLSACSVVGPIEDSRKSIDKNLHAAVELMSWGSGVGANYSNLRPAGALIKSNGGKSSGPLPFAETYDFYPGSVIKQSAMRPGAQMCILNDSHPDIWHGGPDDFDMGVLDKPATDFVNYKRFYRQPLNPSDPASHQNILRRLTGMNLSIAISDDFMNAVVNDRSWNLTFNDEVYETVSAKAMFESIVNAAWHTGDPGLFFIDTTNRYSPTNYLYEINCTNPCGEVPLPDGGLCNLGHMNLSAYVADGKFNYDLFEQDVVIAVRFLDDVVSVNHIPFKEIRARNDGERRIGLGILALADAFLKLGIRYGSDESVKLVEDILKRMCHAAYNASIDLAIEKGEFPDIDREAHAATAFALEKLTETQRDAILNHGIRNCAILTIAPTGTTAQIIGASGTGIEPIFSWEMTRVDSFGTHVYRMPIYEEFRKQNGEGAQLPAHWVTSAQVGWEEEMRIMEVAQRWIDSSISKTFGLPESATREDIEEIYLEAWKRGLKGVTIFRDNCLMSGQVQNRIEPKKLKKVPRGKYLRGITRKAVFGDDKYYLTFNRDQGGALREMFVASRNNVGKSWQDALSRLISAIMKMTDDPSFIGDELRVIKDEGGQFFEGQYVGSVPALIGVLIKEEMERGDSLNEETPMAKEISGVAICPECGAKTLVIMGGCVQCLNDVCGYTKCG